ncbi:cystatin-like [Crotalus tigris]|uniref:cystatin-like n=1 Tax=Crotalus tigris TaxID=88082 RepID=UPI00192F5E2F|nr:cystatin-like [Crotalus tigris]
MTHSQMPVQSLLCALVMLPLGRPTDLSPMPIANGEVARAAAFAVMEYNKDRHDIPTYFKSVQILYGQSQGDLPFKYRFTIRLVRTACVKRPGTTMAYKKVQECDQIPGYLQVTCNFKVTSHQGDTMTLDIKKCSDSLDNNWKWNS